MHKKQTVLITGITGFLGKCLTRSLKDKGYDVVGIGHSEDGIHAFESKFPSTKVYAIDISNSYQQLVWIMKTHNVKFVIHSAAHKHVKICENNPSRAVEVNVLGSMNVLNACLETNVENAIAISTDKAVNPTCVYGMTKKLMEEMFLQRGFGVFQGVNFLFSTGSVLDIWDKARNEGLTIKANQRATRYFCKINDVCKAIVKNLHSDTRFTVQEIYKIKIVDLQHAYSHLHKYKDIGDYTPLSVEKDDEDLPVIKCEIIDPTFETIQKLISDFYEEK